MPIRTAQTLHFCYSKTAIEALFPWVRKANGRNQTEKKPSATSRDLNLVVFFIVYFLL